MPLSNLTNIIFGRYLKRNVPEDADIPASFRKYLSDEFQSIETNLQEHSEANLQTADSEPHRPRKGMLRYAVAPWNPLGNNYQGLVVYTGSAWQAVQGGSGGGGGSNTEVNDLSASVTWVNVPNANITQSSVTQHQAALSITESQISDLQSYLTSEANDLSTTVTWANVPDANITQSSVTQHQAALSITESQISDLQSYLTAETSHADVLVDGDFTSAGFMKTDGNGVYSIDSSTYLTSHQDISGKANLSGGAVFYGDISIGTLPSSSNRLTVTGAASFYDDVLVTGDLTVNGTTNVVAEHAFYSNLTHSTGGTQTLTTTLTTIGGNAFDTPSGLGSKHIDVSLDIIYYNVNYTNDGELKICVDAPNPSSESVVTMGTVQTNFNPTSYMKTWAVTGDFTKHLSPYCGVSKNNSSGGASMGLIYNYRYDASSNYTYVTTGLYTNAPSNGDTIYLHPFDWESQGTSLEGRIYMLDGTTDSTVAMRRDFTQSLGYFTSSVGVSVKARKVSSSGTSTDNIQIDAIQGKTVKIRN